MNQNRESEQRKKAVIISYTAEAAALNRRLCTALQPEYDCTGYQFDTFKAEGLSPFHSAVPVVGDAFNGRKALIFICAAGIAVRQIASFIRSKTADPPVVVIDEEGSFTVPILSGHLGGANELAIRCADILHAVPVITTATDRHGKFAVDVFARNHNLILTNMQLAKEVSSAVLAGRTVYMASDERFVRLNHIPKDCTPWTGQNQAAQEAPVLIYITPEADVNPDYPWERTLKLVPKQIVIGAGCRRGTAAPVIETALEQFLSKHHLDMRSIRRLCSIDLKADEEGMAETARRLQVPFVTFTSLQLEKAAGEFSASSFVKSVTGVDNVCGRSAVCGCGNGGRLLFPKEIFGKVTLAAAMVPVDI